MVKLVQDRDQLRALEMDNGVEGHDARLNPILHIECSHVPLLEIDTGVELPCQFDHPQ
jgi:hypothetical protein